MVGAVFNVAMQLGGPLGLAISTIMSQSKTPAGAEGEALMDGYSAAFYTYGVIGGVGLILTLILASNQDPAEFSDEAPKKSEDLSDVEALGSSEIIETKGQATSSLSLSSFISPTVIEEEKN